jgi:hypothetical protein
MDQRTRELLPALPALAGAAEAERSAAAQRLAAAQAANPEELFSVAGGVEAGLDGADANQRALVAISRSAW